MGWTARIILAFVVLVALGAVGLAVYASRLTPPHHVYQQVIPSEHFSG
jgi:hypothetical protein